MLVRGEAKEQRSWTPGRRLAAILDETKLRRVLVKMLDENEFLSPYGLRSVSRYHAEHPYEEIGRRLTNFFFKRRGGPAPGLRWNAEVSGGSALAGLPAVQRVFSWRQRGRARRQPPDRVDGNHRPDYRAVCGLQI
jgi:hypothetical protein